MARIALPPAHSPADLRHAGAKTAEELRKRRSSACQVRSDFITGHLHGLVRGRVDLAHYLTLVMLGKAPDPDDGGYRVAESNRFLAECLGLHEPAELPSRRLIRDSLNRLAKQRLIRIEEPSAVPPGSSQRERLRRILLLEPGTAEPYRGPGSQYVNLGAHFWANGWHAGISSVALAMLLITLDQHARNGQYPKCDPAEPPPSTFWISPTRAQTAYQLPEGTRSKGWHELHRQGVVAIGKTGVRKRPGVSSTPQNIGHVRNTYRLTPGGFAKTPDLYVRDTRPPRDPDAAPPPAADPAARGRRPRPPARVPAHTWAPPPG